RVVGDCDLELDIDPETFEQQMEWLSRHATVLDIDTVCRFGSQPPSVNGRGHDKPVVVLTFDDAYEDFYTVVWPILKKFNFPAVLYTPTLYIENPSSVPLSRPAGESHKFRPVTWEMLAEMRACPLVTIGA